MIQPIKIAPSILAADFAHLAEEVASAEAAGADYIHVDVMDGHFVPNISIGPPVVRALRRVTHLPLDVHLMISDPARYVPAFAEAGADGLTVHVEATPHLHRILQQIRDLGVRPGISLNPATPAVAISEVLNDVELVLVMTVNPGFGGQPFIEHTLDKIARVREMLDSAASEAELEVDGGIGPQTAERVVAAGATVLVAGEAIFGAPEGVAAALAAIRETAHKGQDARGESRQRRSPNPHRGGTGGKSTKQTPLSASGRDWRKVNKANSPPRVEERLKEGQQSKLPSPHRGETEGRSTKQTPLPASRRDWRKVNKANSPPRIEEGLEEGQQSKLPSPHRGGTGGRSTKQTPLPASRRGWGRGQTDEGF